MYEENYHILSNHYPVYGTIIGEFILLHGLFIKSRKTILIAYLTLFLSSLAANFFFLTIDADAKLTGKVRNQFFDYNAFGFRESNETLTNEAYLEKLEKRHQGIEIQDYEVLNKKELSKPIIENYSFSHSNAVEVIGDKMYFSPLLFSLLKSYFLYYFVY